MNSKKGRWPTIDYETLPYKLHYLLFCAAKGGILPYMVVFIKEKLGLSTTTLATMLVIRAFIIVICKPMIGLIVDYFNKLKVVMIVLTIGEIIFYYLILIIPRIDRSEDIIIFPKTVAYNSDTPLQAIYDRTTNNFTLFADETLTNESATEFLHYHETEQSTNETRYCLTPFFAMNCKENFENQLAETSDCFFESSNLNFSLSVTVKHLNSLSQNSDFSSSTKENVYFKCYVSPMANQSECNEGINEQQQVSYSTIIINVHDLTKSSQYSILQGEICCRGVKEREFSSNTECITTGEYHTVTLADESMPNTTKPRKSVYMTYQYWLCALVWIISGVCSNAMFTLSDTACYECLQRTGKDYGKQRLWGAVSWGIVSPATGFFNDLATGGSKIPDYSPGFYIFGILSIFEIINLQRLNIVKPPRSNTFFKDFRKIFHSIHFIVFITSVFLIGFFTNFMWYYLMVYVETVGGNRLLMGLVNTMQCFLGEIPFMFFSGIITNKIGHRQVLILSFAAFALRFFCYYVIRNPWYILPVECLHGLTYGVFYTAMTAFAKVSSVPGTEATTQSVLCATYEGLGVGVGAIVSGICFDIYGYRDMFFVASISSLACAVLLGLASLALRMKPKTTVIKPVPD